MRSFKVSATYKDGKKLEWETTEQGLIDLIRDPELKKLIIKVVEN